MFFSLALSDAWNGLLQYAITDLAHLVQDGFEFSVIGNRCFVERGLDALFPSSHAFRELNYSRCSPVQSQDKERLGYYRDHSS